MGVLFAAVAGTGFWLWGQRLGPAMIGATTGGVIVAVVVFWTDRLRRKTTSDMRQALGFALNREIRREAMRAPPSAGPVVRQRQLQVVNHFYGLMHRQALRNSVIFSGCLALQVFLALLSSSPWFWGLAGWFALLLLITPLQLRSLRRRQQALLAAEGVVSQS